MKGRRGAMTAQRPHAAPPLHRRRRGVRFHAPQDDARRPGRGYVLRGDSVGASSPSGDDDGRRLRQLRLGPAPARGWREGRDGAMTLACAALNARADRRRLRRRPGRAARRGR